MPSKRKTKTIRSYRHEEASRVNLPTVETNPSGEETAPVHYTPSARPNTDPTLRWYRDPDKRSTFNAPVLSIREKVLPHAFIDQITKPEAETPPNLFNDFNGLPADHSLFDFYQHRGYWQNRLIHGESERVMTSMLAREGLAGQVQVVYFDPPYGIGYKSNFQPSTNNLNVDDKKSSIPVGDPATVTAFRDTYRNGIHSYLDAIHTRLILIRELLADTGSVFLQIGDDNVHRLALLCDEVFGHENKMSTITWRPTGGSSAKTLPETASYFLWYAKDHSQVKYRQLYEPLTRPEIIELFSSYVMVELPDGVTRRLTSDEKLDPDKYLPDNSRVYRRLPLTSQGASKTGRTCWYEYEGIRYHSGNTSHWSVSTPTERTHSNGIDGQGTQANGVSSPTEGESISGLDRLAQLGRLDGAGEGKSLGWKQYEDEVPGRRIDNVWHKKQSAKQKRYVVETATSVVERCILMASDPGDLVFDPTCGSGVTAEAAERWGRRWITCDTSPVAVAIARQRLITGVHPWWQLDSHQDDPVDPSEGFVYETIQRVSAATLAYDQVNEPKNTIPLVDKPLVDRSVHRSAAPFTVESESPYVYVPFHEPDADHTDLGTAAKATQEQLVERLLGAKIGTADGRRVLEVTELERWNEGRLVTYESICHSTRREDGFLAAVMFASPDATVTGQQVSLAVAEAKQNMPDAQHLIVVGWSFSADIQTSYRNVEVLKVQANRDLQIEQLDGDTSFTMLGEPELQFHAEDDGMISVEVLGFDTYDPATGGVTSGEVNQMKAWMVDTSHDGMSFFATLTYLPDAGNDPSLKRLVKELGRMVYSDAVGDVVSMRSQPFKPSGRPVAVKIVTTTGAEMTCVVPPDKLEDFVVA